MKLDVTPQIAEDMVIGASIYSTGGGFQLPVQRQKFQAIFDRKQTPSLISADELADDDIVCTAYIVGSSANKSLDLAISAKKALGVLEKYTGKKVGAIFAGETNIEGVMLELASYIGLPVFDGDCTGGRAVPEIQFDNMFVFGKSVLPMVVVTEEGEVAVLAESPSSKRIEDFARTLSTKSVANVLVFDHVMSVKEAKQYLSLDVMAKSIKTGAYIRENSSSADFTQHLVKQLDATVLLDGKVTKIELENKKDTGFLEGYYYITDNENNELKVYVKNENLFAWKNGELIVTSPDIIATIDKKEWYGVHNSLMVKGQEVIVVGIKADHIRRSENGLKIFSPQTLGFDLETKLL